jgi:hypothetical protein|tara:strand:+ start:211 stop:462 length:252 start_codon:yes stop_codon:yes gene_type:complete
MQLNNDITDNFADSSYQFNEYKFNKDFQELLCNQFEQEVREHEDSSLGEGKQRLVNEEGEEFGGYRSMSFSELNKDIQDEYYD